MNHKRVDVKKMLVEYIKPIISNNDNIQKTAINIGRMENKVIGKLIKRNGITSILEQFLSKRELNRYYRDKFKLKELLHEEVSK